MTGLDSNYLHSPLTSEAAGAVLRQRRLELHLSQAQVVERTTVPSTQYLSRLEGGQVRLAKSRHLPSLARVLELTPADVAAITGVDSAVQFIGLPHIPVINRGAVLAGLGHQPVLVRLGTEPLTTVFVMDPDDRTPEPGRWYVVGGGPGDDPIQLYQGHCITFQDQLLIVCGHTAREVGRPGHVIFGRITQTLELQTH